MATRSSSGFSQLAGNYMEINTVSALLGIVFAISAAVQYLGATISIEHPMSYSYPTEHALLVSFVVLLLAFATSETRSWDYYEGWEKLVVGVTVVGMIAAEYIAEVGTIVTNNQPWAGTIMFALGVVAWGILSR